MKMHVQHDNSMMAAMHNMMQEMSHASVHGDPDNHFARVMQLHHAGAINMAELVLKEGHDLTIAGMAKELIRKQKEEIAALQLFLNNHRPMPHSENAAFNTEMKKTMDMMDLNSEQEELTGDPDHDFAALMVPHHQNAVEMADLIIQHGSNPDIKRMAGIIKTDQEAEIQALHKWLNEHRA